MVPVMRSLSQGEPRAELRMHKLKLGDWIAGHRGAHLVFPPAPAQEALLQELLVESRVVGPHLPGERCGEMGVSP